MDATIDGDGSNDDLLPLANKNQIFFHTKTTMRNEGCN